MNTDKECRCYIKKTYLSNYLFEECDMEFKVYCNNSWQMHAFKFITDSRRFNILCESKKGPMIIEYFEERIIAT